MKYAHARALAEALEALESIESDAGQTSHGADRPGRYGRLAGVAAACRTSLTDVLIVAKVWTDDEVAAGVLDAD